MSDLFPLQVGARYAAFEWLSANCSLRFVDAPTTLRASDASPNTAGASESEPKKPHMSLADLVKKAAELDAKAHKWEIVELRNTIARLRNELSGFWFLFLECRNVDGDSMRRESEAEEKLVLTSRWQDIPVAQGKMAALLPPTDEVIEAGSVSGPTRNGND